VANVGELLAERQDEPAIRYLSMRMVDLSWSELDRNGPSEDIRKQVDFAIEGWRDNPFAWYVRSLTWGDDSDPNAADDRQMAIGLERKRVANGETGPEFLSLLLSIDVLARLNELRELVPGPFSAWKQDEKTVRDTLDVLEDILLEADEAELADVAQGLPVGLIAQAMAVRSTLRMQLGMPADVEAAIDAADRAVKEFPQVPDAHLARAMAIGAEGRWLASTPGADRQRLAGLQTELQRELDQAVALDRSYGPAYLMRAAMYAAFGPADKALEDLSEAKHWLPKLDPRLEQSIRNMIESQPAVPQPQPPTVPAGPQTQSTIALLDTIKQALRQYMDDRATYPESGIENLLKALGPEGTGTLALAAGQTDRLGRIVDGWGRPLVYKRTEEGGFRLYSVGPNGRDEDGGGDDVQLPDK
ncbi:MAG TPA: type II secretion system protein GspG, partial [Pirellulales bacterium]|nr:type II secretion system protein GspG [Pirellulales bacterium]